MPKKVIECKKVYSSSIFSQDINIGGISICF